MRRLVNQRQLLAFTVLLLTAFAAIALDDLSAQTIPNGPPNDPDTLRKLFVTSSDRFPVVLARHPVADGLNRGRPVWLLTPEDLIARLDSAFLILYGEPFLTNNDFASGIVDSLRLQFYKKPKDFGDDRIDHLETISRIASAGPFARAHPKLIGLLRMERDNYFNHPDSYDLERLGELDEISMRVSSLPFLRGSPKLVAKLESARLEYERVDDIYPTERLVELDNISLQVTGTRFVKRRDYRTVTAVTVTGLGLIALLIWATLGRSERTIGTRGMVPNETTMSVAEACLILGVEPDSDLRTLSRAYRKQQKRYHPDVVAHLGSEFVGLAEQRTRSINEAYALLSNRMT